MWARLRLQVELSWPSSTGRTLSYEGIKHRPPFPHLKPCTEQFDCVGNYNGRTNNTSDPSFSLNIIVIICNFFVTHRFLPVAPSFPLKQKSPSSPCVIQEKPTIELEIRRICGHSQQTRTPISTENNSSTRRLAFLQLRSIRFFSGARRLG